MMDVRNPAFPDPCTWIGVWRSLLKSAGENVDTVASPSLPNQLKPQSQTVPSDFKTMQWRAPPQIDTTVAEPLVAIEVPSTSGAPMMTMIATTHSHTFIDALIPTISRLTQRSCH